LLLLLLLLLHSQVPLASIPQFYFPGGGAADSMDDDVKQQFVSSVNALFEPHPAGLNLEQFSAVVQEVRCRPCLAVLLLTMSCWTVISRRLASDCVLPDCDQSL
jgi:hypothetical protein